MAIRTTAPVYCAGCRSYQKGTHLWPGVRAPAAIRFQLHRQQAFEIRAGHQLFCTIGSTVLPCLTNAERQSKEYDDQRQSYPTIASTVWLWYPRSNEQREYR
jgi:hypothetical protein